jgi:hypothetical protein
MRYTFPKPRSWAGVTAQSLASTSQSIIPND